MIRLLFFYKVRNIRLGCPKVKYSFEKAKAAERVVSIPVHPGLTEQEVDYIVSSLQKYA